MLLGWVDPIQISFLNAPKKSPAGFGSAEFNEEILREVCLGPR